MAVDVDELPQDPPLDTLPPHECPHCTEIAELQEHVAATDVAVATLASAAASEADEEAAFFDALAGDMLDDATE